jgi:hypothetical protein
MSSSAHVVIGWQLSHTWPTAPSVLTFSTDWKSNLSHKVTSRPTVSRPVFLGVKRPSGGQDQILLLSDGWGFVDTRRPLWREDESVVYNFCWSLPAQLFSDPSPAGLMTVFYCLRFETPPTRRARFPYLSPRNRLAQLYPRALGSLFVASYDSQGCGGGIRTHLHTS